MIIKWIWPSECTFKCITVLCYYPLLSLRCVYILLGHLLFDVKYLYHIAHHSRELRSVECNWLGSRPVSSDSNYCRLIQMEQMLYRCYTSYTDVGIKTTYTKERFFQYFWPVLDLFVFQVFYSAHTLIWSGLLKGPLRVPAAVPWVNLWPEVISL